MQRTNKRMGRLRRGVQKNRVEARTCARFIVVIDSTKAVVLPPHTTTRPASAPWLACTSSIAALTTFMMAPRTFFFPSAPIYNHNHNNNIVACAPWLLDVHFKRCRRWFITLILSIRRYHLPLSHNCFASHSAILRAYTYLAIHNVPHHSPLALPCRRIAFLRLT